MNTSTYDECLVGEGTYLNPRMALEALTDSGRAESATEYSVPYHRILSAGSGWQGKFMLTTSKIFNDSMKKPFF